VFKTCLEKMPRTSVRLRTKSTPSLDTPSKFIPSLPNIVKSIVLPSISSLIDFRVPLRFARPLFHFPPLVTAPRPSNVVQRGTPTKDKRKPRFHLQTKSIVNRMIVLTFYRNVFLDLSRIKRINVTLCSTQSLLRIRYAAKSYHSNKLLYCTRWFYFFSTITKRRAWF